jgi:hypothetical protein
VDNPRTGDGTVSDGKIAVVCQPVTLGIDDRVCGVCRKLLLAPYVTECRNCPAKILWDMA